MLTPLVRLGFPKGERDECARQASTDVPIGLIDLGLRYASLRTSPIDLYWLEAVRLDSIHSPRLVVDMEPWRA